ncbi:MAG TPA: hypothetical protein VFY17_07205 [Pilimelia sp.]|nr:hypothetical protein [Pilimelia sp.]
MNRALRASAFAAAFATAVVSAPGLASANAAGDPVTATAKSVALGKNPWAPFARLPIALTNPNETATPATFQLLLRGPVGIRPDQRCKSVNVGQLSNVPTGATAAYECTAGRLPGKSAREAALRLVSTADDPVFGIVGAGWTRGVSATGQVGKATEFAIGWPAKTPVRLAAAASRNKDGAVGVNVIITNAGSATLSGYSVVMKAGTGATPTSKACRKTPEAGAGACEVRRGREIAAGASESFTVKFSVPGRAAEVELWLAPGNRHPNEDRTAKVVLPGKA